MGEVEGMRWIGVREVGNAPPIGIVSPHENPLAPRASDQSKDDGYDVFGAESLARA